MSLNNWKAAALAGFAAAAAIAPAAYAKADQPSKSSAEHAVIRFADLNGIRSWRAEDNRTLLIEGRNRQWYRAELVGYCPGLRFATAIGFVTDPLGDLDRFGSVYVEGDRCWFKSFEKIEKPARD